MATVIATSGRHAQAGGTTHSTTPPGRRIAAGAREQGEVEDALHVAALSNGLVRDDGERPSWATIRSGLGKGLQEPKNLDADRG
jgi:hypothetical protein